MKENAHSWCSLQVLSLTKGGIPIYAHTDSHWLTLAHTLTLTLTHSLLAH